MKKALFYILAIPVVLLLFIIAAANIACAGQVILEWDANTEPDLEGYRIYKASIVGMNKSDKFSVIAIVAGDVTTYSDTVSEDESWVYIITAFDTSGNESEFGNAVWHWDRAGPAIVDNFRRGQ